MHTGKITQFPENGAENSLEEKHGWTWCWFRFSVKFKQTNELWWKQWNLYFLVHLVWIKCRALFCGFKIFFFRLNSIACSLWAHIWKLSRVDIKTIYARFCGKLLQMFAFNCKMELWSPTRESIIPSQTFANMQQILPIFTKTNSKETWTIFILFLYRYNNGVAFDLGHLA